MNTTFTLVLEKNLNFNPLHLVQRDLVSETLLPQIRTTALMMVALRHDFAEVSPEFFADEADFLAARLLILRATQIALLPKNKDLLALANQRAEHFAEKMGLAFQKVESFDVAHQHENLLTVRSELSVPVGGDIVSNSQILRHLLEQEQKNIA